MKANPPRHGKKKWQLENGRNSWPIVERIQFKNAEEETVNNFRNPTAAFSGR